MKKLIIINGYVWMIALPFTISRYISTRTISSKWGSFIGNDARDALIGYSLLTLLFGWMSIKETLIYYKNYKIDNNTK